MGLWLGEPVTKLSTDKNDSRDHNIKSDNNKDWWEVRIPTNHSSKAKTQQQKQDFISQ